MLKFQKAGNLVNKSNAIQSAIKDIWILLVSAAGPPCPGSWLSPLYHTTVFAN